MKTSQMFNQLTRSLPSFAKALFTAGLLGGAAVGVITSTATPAHADFISRHAYLDGEIRSVRTCLGFPCGTPVVTPVKESQTTKVGFQWTGWGFDLLNVYQPIPGGATPLTQQSDFSWQSTQQIAVYDPSIPTEYQRMGSIRDALANGGYYDDVADLLMPAFGAGLANSADNLSLFTAIEVGQWVAGGATFDFYSPYSFSDGVNLSLPGVLVSTSPFAWDPTFPGGWKSAPGSLYSGISFVSFATDGSVKVPGPLPILGIGAAFAFSRKLRKRIMDGKSPQAVGADS